MIRKDTLTIVIGSFIAFCIGAAVIYGLTQQNSQGDHLSIRGLSAASIAKPSDKRTLDVITHELYAIVRLNNAGDIPSGSIKDFTIRDGSYRHHHDKEDQVHQVTFLVDSASLQQSYAVSYAWSSDNVPITEKGQYQYATLVSCPSLDLMTYGIFPCRDSLSFASGSQSPDLGVNWDAAKDDFGDSLSSQLSVDDKEYISTLLVSDYSYRHTLQDKAILATVDRVRQLRDAFEFSITLNSTDTYTVTVRYVDQRLITIQRGDEVITP